MTYIFKENYEANRTITVGTLKFELKLSKKAFSNTRAIPTVNTWKNKNFEKSSEKKMTLVKVVANDSSYCSKFFLFQRNLKIEGARAKKL